ncbi:hypothetical protein Dimus_035858 [Dionaea muscipula]
MRRDGEDEIPAKNDQNEEVAEEGQNQEDFEWEVVNEEAEIRGISGSAERFYDAEDEDQGSAKVNVEVPEAPAAFLASPADSINVQKEAAAAGVDPSGPVGSISDSDFAKLQAEFERARADRIQAELDRGQAKNSRLVALLQQAKSQPKP